MKHKVAWKWVLLLGVLLLLIIYELNSLRQKEAAAPTPKVTVGAKKVEAYISQYEKEDTVTDFTYKKSEQKTYIVNPRSQIQVTFEDEPETVEITEVSRFLDEDIEELIVNGELNNRSGERDFIIRVKWEDQTAAVYNLHLNVKELVTYQELLAKEKDDYSMFCIAPDLKSQDLNSFNENNRILITTSHGTTSLEEAKKEYPELKLKSPSTFILFNYREEIYRSDNLSDFKTFIQSLKP
ncbi:hypothetical protein [Peribacillus sp. SCS-155]|uniref:hypothetical protein n=1 Tax=Peribacillus sedimenti TaxID=3115297 RepID=UPI0039059558